MYEVFEPFLRVSTWHTTHPKDDERFHIALNEVVRNSDFDPAKMGAYFQEFLGVSEEHPLNKDIHRRARQAEEIQSFLFDIGEAERS